MARSDYVESAIARTLTGDIYRADDRAINSVNREIFSQQTELAQRIRSVMPKALLDVNRDVQAKGETMAGQQASNRIAKH
jgi:hypothetical protein